MSKGIESELQVTSLLKNDLNQKPKICKLFTNPHEHHIKKSFEAVDCICALAKSQPQILIQEWDSFKLYLDIVFNFEDE